MSGEPESLEEAITRRDEYARSSRIQGEREMNELIVTRWPESEEAKALRTEVEEGEEAAAARRSAVAGERFLRRLPPYTAAAEKAVATKRLDKGFGGCSRPGCARPAAELNGECVEHRAGTRAAETRQRR